ncbi:MAG: hypothetical protein HRU15_04110 [Planctomycetes bacterium]|nr:hypothetical protein [Planctomycetota bacterium]
MYKYIQAVLAVCILSFAATSMHVYAEEEVEMDDEEMEMNEGQEQQRMIAAVLSYLKENRESLHKILLEIKANDAERFEDIVGDMGWELYEFIEEGQELREQQAELKEWDIDDEEDEGGREERRHFENEIAQFKKQYERRAEQIKLRLEEGELRLRLNVLEDTYRAAQGKDPAIKKEIEKITRTLFDVIITRRKIEVKNVRAELTEMEVRLKELEDNREVIIQKKIADMIGGDLLDW